jgi:hypothetical protein
MALVKLTLCKCTPSVPVNPLTECVWPTLALPLVRLTLCVWLADCVPVLPLTECVCVLVPPRCT